MLRPTAALTGLAFAMLFVIVACSPQTVPTTPSGPGSVPPTPTPLRPTATAAPLGEVKIGAALSLTKAAAVYGDSQKKAIELAVIGYHFRRIASRLYSPAG